MKQIIKFTVISVLFIAGAMSATPVHAQNGSVRTGTVTNRPSSGYEVKTTFKYQFIWCVDEIKCVVSLQSEEALAYHYGGKRLTAADVKEYGGFNSPRSNRSTTVDVSAVLMNGQSSYRGCASEQVKMTNLVYAWGGCFGDTHGFFCDGRGKNRDIIPDLWLSKFSTDAKYIDYELESKLKKAEDARVEAAKKAEEEAKRKAEEEEELKKQEEAKKKADSERNAKTDDSKSEQSAQQQSQQSGISSSSSSDKTVNDTDNSDKSSGSGISNDVYVQNVQKAIAEGRIDPEKDHRPPVIHQRKNDTQFERNKQAAIAASNAKLAQSQQNLNQAMDNFTNAVGGIMQARAAERAAREARLERERREREEQKRIEREAEAERLRLEAEHFEYITGKRSALIKKFEDGRLPLSSDKINGNEVWYFAWRGKPDNTVSVTGVFPIARYADGSFPYKNTVLKELDAAGGAGKITVIGWFATRSDAQQALNSFLTIAKDGEVNVKSIIYKGKPQSTDKAVSGDFWETGNAAQKQADKTDSTKKDDYWK